MGLLKLGGLTSGIDTEGLIKQLMNVERRPVALLEKRTDGYTSQANAWRDLNSRLFNLQNRLEDLKKISGSTWSGKKVSSSDEKVLTAQADSTATPGTHTVEVVTKATATTWESNLVTADPTSSLGYSGTIQVSGGPGDTKTFDVQASDSLNSIATTINARTDLGFSAKVLQVNPGDYRLVLTGKTGTANDFSLTDAVGTAASQLKIAGAGPDAGLKVTAALDGQIKVDNIDISVSNSTAQNVIPGVTLNLLQSGTATVTIGNDTQKALDAVKSFVDQYNSVVDFIDQQNKYDDKNKQSGTLFGEGTLQSVSALLSQNVSDVVSGLAPAIDNLASIGITTAKFSAGGAASRKLTIDEAKLTDALTQNSDAVKDVFTIDNGVSKGVAVRMVEALKGYTKTGGILLGRAKSLDDTVSRLKDQVKYYDEVLAPKKEKRMRDQFTAMEKAMTMFQHQGSFLSSQLASLPRS